MPEPKAAPQVGDIVHIVGSIYHTNTLYIEEHRITAITDEHVTIEHLATHTLHGRQEAHGAIRQEPVALLTYFSRPLDERIQEHFEIARRITEQLRQTNAPRA